MNIRVHRWISRVKTQARLRPELMDTLAEHKSAAALRLLESGGRAPFLLRYSQGYNPIERAYRKWRGRGRS